MLSNKISDVTNKNNQIITNDQSLRDLIQQLDEIRLKIRNYISRRYNTISLEDDYKEITNKYNKMFDEQKSVFSRQRFMMDKINELNEQTVSLHIEINSLINKSPCKEKFAIQNVRTSNQSISADDDNNDIVSMQVVKKYLLKQSMTSDHLF